MKANCSNQAFDRLLGVARILLRGLIVAICLFVTPALAEQGGYGRSSFAANIMGMLEFGVIKQETGDHIFKGDESRLTITRTGNYAVFSIEGLDATDSISLISRGGKFFYAHYGSCSESKTFFNHRPEYVRYLLNVR